ncbi:GTP cyclohydrolase II-domain-containing protein, partial [Kickxella alabastrina]|uniref:GTP cyclohydrolase II-domain-containing protein n=1 Tax=Kickxella alabastrina TaxID=61397 RepID=UPI00221E6F0C
QVRARIPYPGGHFYLHLYHTAEDNKEHLAIVFGDDIRSASLERIQGTCETEMQRRIRGASTVSQKDHSHGMVVEDSADRFYSRRISLIDAPLVRIHSECFTGETVSSVRCDCGYQLAEAMRLIQREGRGVIVYLRQEGRGIGLLEKLKAYNLQDMGHDTVDANLLLNHPADARTYGAARAILVDLGVSKMRLLTNNVDKIRQICGAGAGSSSRLEVVCHVPMFPRWWLETGEEGAQAETGGSEDLEADKYLRTKAERMGHMLSMSESSACLPGIINH